MAEWRMGVPLPLRSDAIRIVPVYHVGDIGAVSDAAQAVPSAQLTYRGGPLLTGVQVFTIFWGQPWSAAQSALASHLNQFFDAILGGPLIDQLAEYSTAGMNIGHGKRIGSATITAPAPARSVSDGAIQHFLQQEIATNASVPQATSQTLYFVYLPPGTTVTQGGSRSCQAFCGYHNDIAGQIFYAVMPFAGCNGCTGSMPVSDAMTLTSSHELCESITDPVPGQGSYDDANGEIGDICAWQAKTVTGFTVQKEWSNKANACV